MHFGFYYNCFRKDLTNFSFLRHRKFSGFLVSMHQSGTHWLKHMLAIAIADEYELPMPQYNHANDIIGGPKDPRLYPHAPKLASSHTIPHPLLRSKLFRTFVKFPRYVILVRDVRASLISNYEKWETRYHCKFSEYLRGDIRGRKFTNDIWWCIHFLNSWGYLSQKYPLETLIVRYEDLTQNTLAQLERINIFWDLSIGNQSFLLAIKESSKEKMLKKHDPIRPGIAVRKTTRTNEEVFTDADNVLFRDICKKYLRYNFGYDYTN